LTLQRTGGIRAGMRAPVTTPCTAAAGSQPGEPVCFHCPARMSDLCAGVPDDELKLMAAISKHLTLEPGETLILDGDASDHVYNVVSGTLMMTRLGADGRRQILAFLLTGSFIGFSSDQLYKFNVEAVAPAELCRFERKKIEPLFQAFPEMERGLRRMAAKVIEDSLDLVFTLGRRNATERVSAFLLHLRSAQRGEMETPPGPGHAWQIPMTRTDIADYLGLTIETVSRVLSRLKAKGIVRLPTLHSFEIADEARLVAAAGEA
jgi:CRP/FNR family transcriptional regulator